jgi:hypothetical protein
VREWKTIGNNQVYNRHKLNTILHAEEQVPIFKPEDELYISAHHLNTRAKKQNLKTLTSRIKSTGMCGNDIRRLKIMTMEKPVNKLQNSGNRISKGHGIRTANI